MGKNEISRRTFMAKTAIFFSGAVSVTGGYSLFSEKLHKKRVMHYLDNTNFIINPAFRSISADNGGLELFTFLTNGKKLSYSFSGIEAEIISTVKSSPNIKGIVQVLSQKYGISNDECINRVRNSIEKLNSVAIVLDKDNCNLVFVENIYERTV